MATRKVYLFAARRPMQAHRTLLIAACPPFDLKAANAAILGPSEIIRVGPAYSIG